MHHRIPEWSGLGGTLKNTQFQLPALPGCRQAISIAGNSAFAFLQHSPTAGAVKESHCAGSREEAGIPGGERFPLKHMAPRASQWPWQQLSGFPAWEPSYYSHASKTKKVWKKERGGGGVGGVGERSWSKISLAETERLPGRQIQPIMLLGFTGFPFHFQKLSSSSVIPLLALFRSS